MADHLISLLKDIYIDFKIVQDILLGQLKCTEILLEMSLQNAKLKELLQIYELVNFQS